jgi:hypothetical protein
MKILNGIACNMNWIGFIFSFIEFKFNNWINIEFNSNSNSIENKWNVDWCKKKYCKSIHEYGVEKNLKMSHPKRHLSMLLYSKINGLNIFHFGIVNIMITTYGTQNCAT